MPAAKRRPVLDGVVHGTTGYRAGCGCAKCRGAKSAQRADERKRAADRKAAAEQGPAESVQDATGPAPGPVTPAGSGSADGDAAGPVEQAVRDELAQHDGAPGLSAMRAVAAALAREIDERATPSIAGASSTLLRYLTEIRKASRQVDGELAELMEMLGEEV